MEEQEETKQVNLGDKVIGKIETPLFDINSYIGKKAKIESVKEYKGKNSYYVKIETEPFHTVPAKNQYPEKKIRANKLLGLQEDQEGNIGWSEGSKTDLFLKKMKVNHYKDLVGKEVTLQSNTAKNGKDYLSFI